MQQQIAKLMAGLDLTAAEMTAAFETIMDGQASDAQIGGLLVALAIKGETVEEIAAAAAVMRARVTPIPAPAGRIVLDTCGTGGDRLHTFNISTAAAIIAAAAGATVAKHGNRSATSGCGSAEVLAELGVNVSAPVATVAACLREANIGFCFAPLLHGAMKFAAGPRKQLGVRTIFNILGPLTNPASARRQLLGVFSGKLAATLARVLGRLGSERAMVVHGEDGLDEITLTGPTHVAEWIGGNLDAGTPGRRDAGTRESEPFSRDTEPRSGGGERAKERGIREDRDTGIAKGILKEYDLTPADFGVASIRLADIQVSSPAESAAMIREVLAGKPGPPADIACVNAAAACQVAGIAADLKTGMELCRQAIAAGTAARTLEMLVRVSNEGH